MDTLPALTKRPRVRPTGDHIVVMPWDWEDVSVEGMSIRDHGEKLGFGVVQMVGPDVKPQDRMPRFWIGQRVLYNRLAGAEVSLDGERETYVVLLREGDIYGIVEEVSDVLLAYEREHSRELLPIN